MMVKRKTPVRHTVRSHKRNGKPVRSFERGSGQPHKRSGKVVGQSCLKYSDAETVIIDWVRKMPQRENEKYIYHTTFSDLDSIRYRGLIPVGGKIFPGYGESYVYWSPDLGAAKYWSEMGFWRMYDQGIITKPILLRAKRNNIPSLKTTVRKDELISSSVSASVLETWDTNNSVWREINEA